MWIPSRGSGVALWWGGLPVSGVALLHGFAGAHVRCCLCSRLPHPNVRAVPCGACTHTLCPIPSCPPPALALPALVSCVHCVWAAVRMVLSPSAQFPVTMARVQIALLLTLAAAAAVMVSADDFVPSSHADCSSNLVFAECGSACTPTCSQPYPMCTMQCVARCQCPPELPMFDAATGVCIPLDACPPVLVEDSF